GGETRPGRFCLEAMRARGIDLSPVVLDPAIKTGVTVAITSPSDRALVSFLGSIAALREADVPRTLFRSADHVHVSSYYLQEGLRPGIAKLFREAKAAGLTTSLDPGFDPSEKWEPDLRETLAHVDVFFPNEVELRALSGGAHPDKAVRSLQKGGVQIIAKLGAQGALALDRDGKAFRVAAPKIAVVDTTGAGDSFDAGFLHAWLSGATLGDCLR